MDASLSGPRGLYAPLPTATSIRVIELHPLQSDNAPINCTLHLTNLERETLDFQALSYTWGDPLYRYWFDREKHTTWVRDVPIVCNGVSVDVTVNLEHALRAICTRRMNCHELKHQVQYLWIVRGAPASPIYEMLADSALNIGQVVHQPGRCPGTEHASWLDGPNLQQSFLSHLVVRPSGQR